MSRVRNVKVWDSCPNIPDTASSLSRTDPAGFVPAGSWAMPGADNFETYRNWMDECESVELTEDKLVIRNWYTDILVRTR